MTLELPAAGDLAQARVRAHVAAVTDGMLVCQTVPDERPPRFVQVVRTGGPQNGVVDEGMYSLICWDPDDVEAGRLAVAVGRIILRGTRPFGARVPFVRARVLSTYPDPVPESPRHTVIAEIHVKTGY